MPVEQREQTTVDVNLVRRFLEALSDDHFEVWHALVKDEAERRGEAAE